MVENENTDQTQANGAESSAETGSRKRTRLFGARKSSKKASASLDEPQALTREAAAAPAQPKAAQAAAAGTRNDTVAASAPAPASTTDAPVVAAP
jgi:ribonuclease E